MKAKRVVLGSILTIVMLGIIWFAGWAVRPHLPLWENVQTLEYQNMLYVLMCLAVFMGAGLTLRKPKVPVKKRLKQTKPFKKQNQNPVDLGPINKRVDALAEKVADMHTILTFLKNVKQKEGETA